MINFQQLVTDCFVEEVRNGYELMYGRNLEPDFADVLEWTGRLVLENIANSDALYHNVEHTVMVTLVGQSILRGKHLIEGNVMPRDWLHFMIALLCHDAGYVKGICRRDRDDLYATGVGDGTVRISDDGTDVALTPYHVDRSKLFVRERFGGPMLIDLDVEMFAGYIEMTRFPIPNQDFYRSTNGFAALTRAADFIGQLGDPNYLRKIPALYYEFVETGSIQQTGCKSPGHMRREFAHFYWNFVRPYIGPATDYLKVTQEGKQWLVTLHSHVFEVEHIDHTEGPLADSTSKRPESKAPRQG